MTDSHFQDIAAATERALQGNLAKGDLLLLYTDGLQEARNGEAMFGEERISAHLRRDPDSNPAVLCKSLAEAAEDFASQPISDDIAILALRRS